MADDFQSQPKCPYCHDTGVYTSYKGDPCLESDSLCECGIMTIEEYTKKLENDYYIARQETDNLFAKLKAKGIDVIKSIKFIDNELRNTERTN